MASAEDAKLAEQAILIKRLYWLEDLHRIAGELGIAEISNTRNYWELNHDKTAFLVATRLNDESLIRLIQRNAPKYIQLGGFQGQFYSMDEKGNFTLSNSWERVRKNIHKALDKWNEKASGTLQALLNKDGQSTYIELITEIENVINKEYLPSALLPRLQSLKLVFKAGSNKYPYWTIPTEIIPVVREELSTFHPQQRRKTKKIRTRPGRMTRTQEVKILARDLKLDGIVDILVNAKSDINIICHNKFKCRFFKDNEKAVVRLMKPCSNEDDFMQRIQWLSAIINDDVEADQLRKIVNLPGDNKFVTTSFIVALLKMFDLEYEANLVNNLIMLKTLRNKKYPAHPDDGLFLEALRHFGQESIPPDWTVLWERVLKDVTESLTLLRDKLQQIRV